MQEVKAAAAEATKDLAAHEKRQVGLDERRKHASSKAKKLKKSLQEVCLALQLLCAGVLRLAFC